ncbi:MAG: terpene cyclase/mutase family protein [Armatimonadetes bacterium]|nr:terpene cyclase/mutase family protein [Armatimonadota bacterium]
MRRRFWPFPLAVMAISVVAAAPRSAAPPSPTAQRQKIRQAIARGVAFLRRSQLPDGSWKQYPGITALAALAMVRSGVKPVDPAVTKAAAYLARQAKPNGSIYTDAFGPAQALPNYNTALAMRALHAAGNPSYRALVARAQQFLAQSQFDEGEGISRADPRYGGIGYGSREDNPDLSNLQQALEALRETGHPRDSEVFARAIVFLQRCQNRGESNDQAWAANDGGFVYAASGESKADEYTRKPHSSYGSMTYAGIKSYLYCNVAKSDLRVQAAYRWIRQTFTVKENPNMRDDGLYYYYHTMAKTLAILGERVVVDSQGRRRYWAAELAAELIRRQQRDGAWANANRRWREDDKVLVTGYAILALTYCERGL